MTSDPADHIWWLASRASGIVALFLLTMSVLLGLMLGGRLTRNLPIGLTRLLGAEPRLLGKAHEQLAIASLISIGVHAVTLLGDAHAHFSLTQILVPFAAEYRPGPTGVGIVAGYVTGALTLSYYVRNRIGTQLWRRLHRFSIAGYALAVLHTIAGGTDGEDPWLRLPVLASAALVALLLLVRVAEGRRRRPTVQHVT